MTVLAKHAQGKGGPDKIFHISGLAKARAQEVGKENITNATIGAFLDASGNLITMKTVEESLRNIPFEESANYAPISGIPEYAEAAADAVFRDCRPEAFIRGIATPGGTGSIRNTLKNYLEDGQACVISDYHWAAYKNICYELDRDLITFRTFNAEGGFNIEGCFEKVNACAAKQENVLLMLNTPANNPTGFSVTLDEWKIIVEKLTAIANNGKNNVVLLVDTAYIDYAGPGSREFFKLFSNLPKNFLVIVAFSMSKSHTMYGYRSGCMLCVTSDEEEAEAFVKANQFSARATWSNGTHIGQLVLVDLYKNPEKKAAFLAEQEELRLSLLRRAELFLAEAKEAELATCPFESGFFITVPTVKAPEVAAELRKEDIFLVPLGEGESAGLRVAICAIPEEKISGMAQKIKAAMERVG